MSMAKRPSSWPASFAILLAGALAGGGMVSWSLFERPISVQLPDRLAPASATQLEAAGKTAEPLLFPARETFGEALERPLFIQTRRQPSTKPVAAEVAALTPDGIHISGINIIRGRARAFIVSSEAPKGAWLAEGSTVAGWRLAAISSNSVRLEAQGRSAKLDLYKAVTPANSVASAARKAAAP